MKYYYGTDTILGKENILRLSRCFCAEQLKIINENL
jgi:hypothetical protein